MWMVILAMLVGWCWKSVVVVGGWSLGITIVLRDGLANGQNGSRMTWADWMQKPPQ